MYYSIQLIIKLLILLLIMGITAVFAGNQQNVPILTYHNFNPTVPGIMNITPDKFESQIKWLKENGFTVIPLKQLVSYLQGNKIDLPIKSVVITADDGWESVYHYMLPLVIKYQIPVTLFIYPSVISKGPHTLTWEQLKELQNTGLFDIQCHTYWHPNFDDERKTLSSKQYEKLVHVQLFKSKKILEDKLGTKITLLAWPYGIYNKYLEQEAVSAGYEMAFSVDDRATSISENPMAQPRYMISAHHSMKTFARMVNKLF